MTVDSLRGNPTDRSEPELSSLRFLSTQAGEGENAPSLQHKMLAHETTLDKEPKPSAALTRSLFIVLFALLYGAAALFAWATTCILTQRPIGGTDYGLSVYDTIDKPSNLGLGLENILENFYGKSERDLRAARIVQAGVSVFTIPFTSAVCSQAAVVWLQQTREGQTRRQTMALADKSWSDPVLIGKLVLGGWKKYGSRVLFLAVGLNLLGAFALFLNTVCYSQI